MLASFSVSIGRGVVGGDGGGGGAGGGRESLLVSRSLLVSEGEEAGGLETRVQLTRFLRGLEGILGALEDEGLVGVGVSQGRRIWEEK